MKEAEAMDEGRQRLTAKRKFQVYLETRAPGANVGEILRRFGGHVNDPRRIEGSVEGGGGGAPRGRGGGRDGGPAGQAERPRPAGGRVARGARGAGQRAPGEGARAGPAHGGVHPAQKNICPWNGSRGLQGIHVSGERRQAVMALLEEAIAQGLTARAACAVLGLSERRWRVWRSRARVGDFERHAVPAHVRPYNALTPQERELIRSAVGSAEWADASCRELSVKILERHGGYLPPLSIC